MKRMHRVALAAGAAILALTPASATHSWGGYHWATTGHGLDVTVNRPTVFEKQLGPGQKQLTHVFWAIGESAR
jgi:hypothetical protein